METKAVRQTGIDLVVSGCAIRYLAEDLRRSCRLLQSEWSGPGSFHVKQVHSPLNGKSYSDLRDPKVLNTVSVIRMVERKMVASLLIVRTKLWLRFGAGPVLRIVV
jgi:hypothetical protein